MSHHAARRSTLAGSAAGAATAPAARTVSSVQSFSVFREGTTLQIRSAAGWPDTRRVDGVFGGRVFFRFAIVISLLNEKVRQFVLGPDQQGIYAPEPCAGTVKPITHPVVEMRFIELRGRPEQYGLVDVIRGRSQRRRALS